jgi:hypothetical protein
MLLCYNDSLLYSTANGNSLFPLLSKFIILCLLLVLFDRLQYTFYSRFSSGGGSDSLYSLFAFCGLRCPHLVYKRLSCRSVWVPPVGSLQKLNVGKARGYVLRVFSLSFFVIYFYCGRCRWRLPYKLKKARGSYLSGRSCLCFSY